MQTQMQDQLDGIANYWVPVDGGRAYKRGTDVKCTYDFGATRDPSWRKKKVQPYKEISYQLPLVSS